jgi:hypothetical protein
LQFLPSMNKAIAVILKQSGQSFHFEKVGKTSVACLTLCR